jgi:hypothetical protein
MYSSQNFSYRDNAVQLTGFLAPKVRWDAPTEARQVFRKFIFRLRCCPLGGTLFYRNNRRFRLLDSK